MNEIKKIVSENPLNKAFFSKDNIIILQNGIRKRVYDKSYSKYIIGNQSDRELLIIMRSVYLLYSKNKLTNIKQQIIELNNIVINESVPNILSNIKQYISYKKTINNIPIPLVHPRNMSNSGNKSLTSFNF